MEPQLSMVHTVNSLNFMLYPLWKSLPSCLPAHNNTGALAAAVADNINYLVFCQFLLGFFQLENLHCVVELKTAESFGECKLIS